MQEAPFADRRQAGVAALTLAEGECGARELADIALLAAQGCAVPNAYVTATEHGHAVVRAAWGRLAFPDATIAAFAEQVCRNQALTTTTGQAADQPAPAGRWFLAGVPLRSSAGEVFGTICVLSDQPHCLSEADRATLEALGRQLVLHSELRRLVRRERQGEAGQRALAAEAANARLAAIVASSSDAIMSFASEDGHITTWNMGAEQLFGHPEAEAVGGPVNLIVPADLPDGDPTGVFARAMAGHPVVDHETVRVHRNGERIPVTVTAARMLAPDGRVIGVSAIFRDLRPRKRVEAALRVSETSLRQAQKLEAIGRLAAGVAHDFNNVLQIINASLETLLEEVDPGSTASESAGIALGSARRGAYLTNHLLAYARKQLLQPTLIEVAPYFNELRTLLLRTLGPQINVEMRIEPDLPPIQVDPHQLNTALINLAINASHAMPKGGTLTMESRREPRSDGHHLVVLAVRDTGIGIDEATLAQVFEPFFTTKGHDGTGLGLSMVQGFAEQSGGTTRIASKLGVGTVVELCLPGARRRARPAAAGAARDERLSGSGRVLLVDDVPDVLATTRILLKRAGFTVVTAGSARDALALLEGGDRFDVMVSDFAMPDMDGVELIKRARRLLPGLPALVTTGYAEISSADALPADVAVLNKPFQRHQLIEAVLRAATQGK